MAVTAAPAAAPALAALWEGPLCWRLPANPARSRGLPHLNPSMRETKNRLLQPEGLLGACWAFRGKVNTGLSVQIVFCSPLAQVWLSRCLETVLRSRLVQCRDFFF